MSISEECFVDKVFCVISSVQNERKTFVFNMCFDSFASCLFLRILIMIKSEKKNQQLLIERKTKTTKVASCLTVTMSIKDFDSVNRKKKIHENSSNCPTL